MSLNKNSCDVESLQIMWLLLLFPAWVDAVWDVEFTERKPLDDTIEEELTAGGDKAFRNLYQCLLVHAGDQQQSTNKDGASQVKLIFTCIYNDYLQCTGSQVWISL